MFHMVYFSKLTEIGGFNSLACVYTWGFSFFIYFFLRGTCVITSYYACNYIYMHVIFISISIIYINIYYLYIAFFFQKKFIIYCFF